MKEPIAEIRAFPYKILITEIPILLEKQVKSSLISREFPIYLKKYNIM